jgi:hypothetical protein
MLDTLTTRQYMDWRKMMAHKPFGEMAADIRSGQLLSTLANINRNKKSRPNPFKVTEFMLYHQSVERSPEQEAQMWLNWAQAHNATQGQTDDSGTGYTSD